uniref:Uncharacterized protein n=1 Tax=Eptatretus burgeri TaxID=7764 RepID=A0A8C4N7S7_EPTBU
MSLQFVGVEAFITAVTDVFPEFLRGKGRREIFLAVCCVLKLLLGLYMVTEGGIYLFQLIDLFAVSGVTLLWQVFWQCIVVAWVYGGENFMADVTLMIGYRPNSIIKWSLAVVTPAMCMGMFLFTLLKHESVKYKEYVYPPWGEAIGWLMALSSMLCMPCTLLFLLLRSKKGNLVQRWKHLSMPVFESHVEFYRQGLDEVHDCPRDLECNAVSASHSIIPHSATHSPISSFCRRGKKLSRSSLRMCDRDKFRAKVLLNSSLL